MKNIIGIFTTFWILTWLSGMWKFSTLLLINGVELLPAMPGSGGATTINCAQCLKKRTTEQKILRNREKGCIADYEKARIWVPIPTLLLEYYLTKSTEVINSFYLHFFQMFVIVPYHLIKIQFLLNTISTFWFFERFHVRRQI